MTVATIPHEPNLPLALFFKDYLEEYAAGYAHRAARYAACYTANYANYAGYVNYVNYARSTLRAHAPPLITLVYKALSL